MADVWRHKESGDLYLIVEEAGEVVLSMGPLDQADAANHDFAASDYLVKVAEFAAGSDAMQQQRAWLNANRSAFDVVS